jgi:hypothetical protein
VAGRAHNVNMENNLTLEQVYNASRNYLVATAAMHKRSQVTDADLVAAARDLVSAYDAIYADSSYL